VVGGQLGNLDQSSERKLESLRVRMRSACGLECLFLLDGSAVFADMEIESGAVPRKIPEGLRREG